ncbi:MAG: prephenate dehydrogenase/arogenate dehydrogenase family protein [Syntrophales bacterium]|nr:prephenate dehydrogenase/arogenate dehydrogenase family protein [Syntrophales bacterium]
MMPRPIIGIIGGKGAMGSWFNHFFTQEGYEVLIYDLDTTLKLEELAEKSSVVIVSVPIGITCEVIKQVGPYVGTESLLMDLTSLKTQPVQTMLAFSKAEVIGVHPLFGPDVPNIKGQNVVLCPARGEKWLPWLRRVFIHAGASVIETTPERHDMIMAIVQGMNHLNTILLGLTIKEAGLNIKELWPYSTPVFRTKLELLQRLISQDPVLLGDIIGLNPHLPSILATYKQHLEDFMKMVEQKNTSDISSALRRLSKDKKAC